jgi:hypothetical protein
MKNIAMYANGNFLRGYKVDFLIGIAISLAAGQLCVATRSMVDTMRF